MASTDDPRERLKARRERLKENDVPERDKSTILEFGESIDPDEQTVPGEKKSIQTVAAYTYNLHKAATRAAEPLAELDDDGVQALVAELDDEYATSTLAQFQSALKGFYRYHETGVDPESIAIASSDSKSVDERSVLTAEEFFEMREAAANTRDRAMIDLLGYTGQRIRVIQTLRVKDVDLDDGVYYMPDDVEGLKGAAEVMRKRPLLAAQRAVEDWLQHHPTGNPDDALITCLPSAARGNHGERLSQSTMRSRLSLVADRAGIDKPVNPHAFRHYFVTAAKKDYDMGSETIKKLLGHSADSNIMETTYSHLSDDDVITEAEAAYGITEEEERGRLTPPMCPTCGRPLEPDVERCPSAGCREVFTPDAADDDRDKLSELGALLDDVDGDELKAMLQERL